MYPIGIYLRGISRHANIALRYNFTCCVRNSSGISASCASLSYTNFEQQYTCSKPKQVFSLECMSCRFKSTNSQNGKTEKAKTPKSKPKGQEQEGVSSSVTLMVASIVLCVGFIIALTVQVWTRKPEENEKPSSFSSHS